MLSNLKVQSSLKKISTKVIKIIKRYLFIDFSKMSTGNRFIKPKHTYTVTDIYLER